MQLHINTYGAYVHVKDEMFEIRVRDENKEVQKKHYSAQKVTALWLCTGTSLSTDAIKLAITFNIDIVFLEKNGDPFGRVWHGKPGSTTKIRKAQLEASLNSTGLYWVKSWLIRKLENQLEFIRDLKKHRLQHAEYLQDKIDRIQSLILSVQSQEADTVAQISDTLRGLEGTAGRLYFQTLSHVLPDVYKFDGRSSRPAQDAFNGFLNYVYGILYSKVEKALIIAGVDPYLGFMHRDDYNQLSMVFDFIEPYRIYADEVVFRLFSARKVNKAHLDELTNGVTLNKEGKALLVTAFNEFMDGQPIRHGGRNMSRSTAIQYDAHSFGNTLIDKKISDPQGS